MPLFLKQTLEKACAHVGGYALCLPVHGRWEGFEVDSFQSASIIRPSGDQRSNVTCWYWPACHKTKTKKIQQIDTHTHTHTGKTLVDTKPGHPHGKQQPYKAELHPSPADESARALFSLPDSTHNTHATHSHAGTDLYWLLIAAGCHPRGLVRGAALWNRVAPARYIQGASRSSVRLSSLSRPRFLIRAGELESDIVRYGNPLKIDQSMSVVFFLQFVVMKTNK